MPDRKKNCWLKHDVVDLSKISRISEKSWFVCIVRSRLFNHLFYECLDSTCSAEVRVALKTKVFYMHA